MLEILFPKWKPGGRFLIKYRSMPKLQQKRDVFVRPCTMKNFN